MYKLRERVEIISCLLRLAELTCTEFLLIAPTLTNKSNFSPCCWRGAPETGHEIHTHSDPRWRYRYRNLCRLGQTVHMLLTPSALRGSCDHINELFVCFFQFLCFVYCINGLILTIPTQLSRRKLCFLMCVCQNSNILTIFTV